MKRWIIFLTFVSKRSVLCFFLILAAVGLSMFFVKNLNVEAFPDPAPPIVEIVTVYEGRAAEEIERLITIPLEVGLAGMEGMERINTVSLYGLSDIKCKFAYGIDYKGAKQEVINRLANVSMPPDAQPTIIPNMIGEVMRYNLVGSDNLLDLRTIQDWTAARYLKTAKGVEDVSSYGGYIKAYKVTIQPGNLIKYGITLAQVIDSLSKSNLNVGARGIEKGDQFYLVRGIGLIKDVEDIEDVLVTMKNGKPLLIKDIADVTIGNLPQTGIMGLSNKDQSVMGVVLLRKGSQSIPSIKSIHEKVDELNERILPKGIKINPFYERWDLIVTVVKKVIETAMSGIGLVAIALFIFLGSLRAALITAMVIPVSLIITLAIMALRGESANLLSIGAIDFGIIADIPLILIEDYFRLTNKHGPGVKTMARAAQEVSVPMIFSVIIILLAFIPIFMMQGAESQIFSPMAKTYLYAIIFTLVLTFSYLVVSSRLFLGKAIDSEFRIIVFFRRIYLWIVNKFLRFSVVILLIVFTLLGTGIWSAMQVISSQFLPQMDEGNMYIRMVLPYSISLSKTYECAKKVRDILMSNPEVKDVEFQCGRPEDGTDPTGAFNSEFFVSLLPYDQWKEGRIKEDLEKETRTKLRDLFPNADINVSQYIQDNLEEVMSGVKGENSVKIFGDDLYSLDKLSRQVMSELQKIPGVEDLGIQRELGQPNLMIEANRKNIAALGLNVQDVLDTISAALGGKEITQIIEGEKRFSLFLRFPPVYRRDFDKISATPIALPNGGFVPLSRVATLRYDTGASFVYREGFRRFIPVKFSVTSKDLGGTVRKAQVAVEKIEVPKGYYMEWSGIFNEMVESFKRFCVSIPIAVFAILTTLYLLYGSVRNVFIIMAAPLFAVSAGLGSLIFTGESLSVSSMVGFISIIGVSVLNSSVITSHYLRLRMEGIECHKAIMETMEDKFRPVLMGGFVASLGLLPASTAHGIGSQTQKPLAIVVVGGMLVGTALMLFFCPLLLKFIEVEKSSLKKAHKAIAAPEE
ncbi:MAG: efflux RND transporter permease subunit [Candidatus Riflebacteria bacterium]|nr:efflux RND transporter permease subunit [Candidatus Riflebacteria bacterium]